ncbi:MAG: hypothetical protein ACK4PN_08545 [Allorhizobium sp.]
MKKHLLLRLVEGLRRRTAPAEPAAPRPLPEILFTPVIFANGRDDGSEGVKAFFEHRPVVLDGRLIPTDDMAAKLTGLTLRFRHGRIVFRVCGRIREVVGFDDGTSLIVDVPANSTRFIDHCKMQMNVRVQP